MEYLLKNSKKAFSSLSIVLDGGVRIRTRVLVVEAAVSGT